MKYEARPNETQSQRHLWMLISFFSFLFFKTTQGRVFFWEQEQSNYISKNRCIAVHFPAAASTGTTEASRSKSFVVAKFTVASSQLPHLPFKIYTNKSWHIQPQKNLHLSLLHLVSELYLSFSYLELSIPFPSLMFVIRRLPLYQLSASITH